MTATVPHTRPRQFCTSRRQHVTDQDCLACYTAVTPEAHKRRQEFRLRGDCVDIHIAGPTAPPIAPAPMIRPVAVIERREDDDCMVVLECGHFAFTDNGDQEIPCKSCLADPRARNIDKRAGEAIALVCRRDLAALRMRRRLEAAQ